MTRRPPELTPADLDWTELRVIELMTRDDMKFVDVVERAALECTARVLDREAAREEAYLVALEADRDRRRDERRRRDAETHEVQRAELRARATPAQRPTLKTTLGDLLAAKGKQ